MEERKVCACNLIYIKRLWLKYALLFDICQKIVREHTKDVHFRGNVDTNKIDTNEGPDERFLKL